MLTRGLFVQGEVLLGDLHKSGFEIVDEHEGTDAIVVNTCAFVDDAKAESLQVSNPLVIRHMCSRVMGKQQGVYFPVRAIKPSSFFCETGVKMLA